MQQMSVERTFLQSSLRLRSRTPLVVTDCVSLAAAFLAAMLTPSFLLSSKSLARFGCSLINALTTPRCRYQLFAVSGGYGDFTFTNHCRCRLFLICAEIFPLVGNAHRAFRGGKLVRMIFGRSTGKHDIIEKIYTFTH